MPQRRRQRGPQPRVSAAPARPRERPPSRRTLHAPPRVAPTYYALVVPGLEEIASAELERAGASVTGSLSRIDKRDGIVLFQTADLKRVLRCGTIEDVFQRLLDTATPTVSAGPKMLAAQLDRTVFEAAAVSHHAVRPKQYGRSYKVVSRMAGRHPFEREGVEYAFGRAVGAMLPRWSGTEGPAAMEVWAHVVGDRTIAGLRLSGDEMAQRTYKHSHLPASLKPTVARALVMLAEPRDSDIVVDPMCGAGTVLRERAEAGRAKLILGGDHARDALAAARANTGKHTALARWDTMRLPLRDASVDAVITNPPYGRQHEAIPGIERLYSRSLREAARVLRPGGRCVVLTGEPGILTRSMPPSLLVRKKRRLLLRGLAVVAFVLVRA